MRTYTANNVQWESSYSLQDEEKLATNARFDTSLIDDNPFEDNDTPTSISYPFVKSGGELLDGELFVDAVEVGVRVVQVGDPQWHGHRRVPRGL